MAAPCHLSPSSLEERRRRKRHSASDSDKHEEHICRNRRAYKRANIYISRNHLNNPPKVKFAGNQIQKKGNYLNIFYRRELMDAGRFSLKIEERFPINSIEKIINFPRKSALDCT
jgi:hypothetical protein